MQTQINFHHEILMSKISKHSIFFPILFFIIINLVILSVSRVGLSVWQIERVSAVNGWLPLLLQGLRIDISALCWLFGIPTLLSVLFLSSNVVGQVCKMILRVWLTVGSTFILFMELSTPAFIETYDIRPNRLFIEYLLYPKEVFTMLINGHLVAVLSSAIITTLAAILYWKLSAKVVKSLYYPNWKWRPVIALIVAVITFVGARSSFAHRGMNPAMVAFSSDPLVNSLVLNSGYSVLFAVQQLKDENSSSEQYGKMSAKEMFATIKQSQLRPISDYISEDIPTLSYNEATYKGKPKNIVIILEESLGAQFIGILGGKPLSPEFDKLAQEGWLFENMYATGTRSVRGIEAVIAGFTPTPARSTVKLAKSQRNFFTIAELLSRKGYETSFIYGGEKHFDNMASFFYGNGFETIIDENDYTNPEFVGSWGVSDEDLFKKAHHLFNQWSKEDKPFFSLVFSSSNHDPFEFPDGKIALYDKEKQTRNNAAKYADYALGQFFKLAKNSTYWEDTLFLIIADHDSRVAGASLVPIQHFHIPALILGNGVAIQKDKRLVSQIDVPPTLLSLAGISGAYPMLGYDLTKNIDPNRAFMQYNQTQAMMKGNDIVVLEPKTTAKGYTYNHQTQRLEEKELPQSMKKEALAYALVGSYLYNQQLYKLPKEKNSNKN
ncbi:MULTISPECIES: LTA synthase family protein [Pasteurellaceae]|uniref:LTA synthase family protein n=1 Tax=Pasteurella atlantica TaxID=2827233 RepID=A0AAW8CIJ3_9PAST|nr:LTA synthase family protein [Pasteurella atlantica]MBR0573411.1 LTA synthase family protein [Pasteurella atlantica]MDP8039782.1 LTA synthase family protein [Pasteurella atlantica]MDP8041799.1 LTA synthase family protein [Pasteurella atlantica]MDP8043866.1 LTA synthase family protein [Pasteurella atlantica]MDP8046131.1 LTA synthase family protein [Pasteurella atlantica]